LAIERFTDAKVKTAALIGSGRLALPLLRPACAVRRLERILVYSRSSENREKFARQASEQLKISAIAVASPQAAIDQADFVLVSTNSPVAALHGDWLRPGVAVFGIGRPNEFDDQVYLRANLNCVTSKTHELNYYDNQLDQPLIRLSKAGTMAWNSVAEFCDIVAGKVAVPDLSRSLIIFRDSQGGYGDLALAASVYEEAKRRGLGQQFSTE
jgi:ornithine cyclodeaminase/alanine dehydrogenase-like protein (mu-crystallin family)